MEIAYRAETEVCTFLLDASGYCRSVLAASGHGRPGRAVRIPATAEQCIGAQYVASIDVREVGGMVPTPRPGAHMLFARADREGRISLVRTGEVTRFETVATQAVDSGVRERPEPPSYGVDDEELTTPFACPTVPFRRELLAPIMRSAPTPARPPTPAPTRATPSPYPSPSTRASSTPPRPTPSTSPRASGVSPRATPVPPRASSVPPRATPVPLAYGASDAGDRPSSHPLRVPERVSGVAPVAHPFRVTIPPPPPTMRPSSSPPPSSGAYESQSGPTLPRRPSIIRAREPSSDSVWDVDTTPRKRLAR